MAKNRKNPPTRSRLLTLLPESPSLFKNSQTVFLHDNPCQIFRIIPVRSQKGSKIDPRVLFFIKVSVFGILGSSFGPILALFCCRSKGGVRLLKPIIEKIGRKGWPLAVKTPHLLKMNTLKCTQSSRGEGSNFNFCWVPPTKIDKKSHSGPLFDQFNQYARSLKLCNPRVLWRRYFELVLVSCGNSLRKNNSHRFGGVIFNWFQWKMCVKPESLGFFSHKSEKTRESGLESTFHEQLDLPGWFSIGIAFGCQFIVW